MISALDMVVPNKEIVCTFPKGKPNKTEKVKDAASTPHSVWK